MKNNRLIIALLIIIALAAVYYFLGIDYMKQRRLQAGIASDIANTAHLARQVPQPPQDLPARLAAAQARLAAAQSTVPGKPNSTQVINKILMLADECQVKAIPLTTEQWSADKTGKGYLVFRLHLTVQGGFTEFARFVGALENGDFDALRIENLNVTRVVKKAEEKGLPDGTSSVTASLDVAIYAKSASSQ